MSSDASTELRELLESIFEDGVVEVTERHALASFRDEGSLDDAEIRQIFAGFVERTWGEAMADGVLSSDERLLMLTILKELKVPMDSLSPPLRMALSD